jgi:glutamate racemase
VVDDRSRLPIGMFDSGVGGLTVARAVIDLLPHEDIIYLGDTQRCPYGPRPHEEVRQFALEIMDHLVSQGVKLLVIACNSAASAAFEEAKQRYDVSVLSVIDPGVRAAVAATRNRRIGLIGTVATVTSGSYDEALAATKANMTLVSQACPRFVEFVEHNETNSEAVFDAAEEYLAPLKAAGVDTVILGCTHYPLLSGVIQYVMGEEVVLISSAEATATEVFAELKNSQLLNMSGDIGKHRFIATSEEGMFSELGELLLGPAFTGIEYRPWTDRTEA